MNDEIKEILDAWKNKKYILAYTFNYDSAREQNDKILDYITNLQHTEDLYNQLLKDYDELQQDNKKISIQHLETVNKLIEVESRIEKALHLITHSDITDYRVFDEELLDILNGSDE